MCKIFPIFVKGCLYFEVKFKTNKQLKSNGMLELLKKAFSDKVSVATDHLFITKKIFKTSIKTCKRHKIDTYS